MRVGAVGDFGIGAQPAQIPVYEGSPDCGVFTNGLTTTIRGGLVAVLPRAFGERLGFSVRLGFASAATKLAEKPRDFQRLLDPASGHVLVDIDREFRLNTRINTIELDLLGQYALAPAISLSAGGCVGYRIGGTFTATDVILTPDRSFSDGEQSHPIPNTTPLSIRRLAVSGLAALSFPLRIPGNMWLVPSVSARYDLLRSLAEVAWRDASVNLGLGVQFEATNRMPVSPPDTPSIRQTPARDTARHVPALTAAITMEGSDSNGHTTAQAVIRVNEIVFRDHLPLLPVIYFEPGSDTIAARYKTLPAEATHDFSYTAVAELRPVAMSHQVLNLVGMRLREDRTARITLFGTTAGDEPDSLAAQRAARVRSYLNAVWGIAKNRIDVRAGTGPLPRSDDATSDGRGENRRVVIASATAEMLAPVATERVVREFNPPLVKLTPIMSAEAGVRDWQITIRQREKPLALFTMADTRAGHNEISWLLEDNSIDSSLKELVAELRVEDSTGQMKFAYDTISLALERNSTVVHGSLERTPSLERLNYALVGFGFRSAAGDRGHDLWLRELAGQMHDGARVRVVGYTDRIGDDSYNMELSRGRAQYVADRLKTFMSQRGIQPGDIEILGAGVDTSRFPNDLPEGRVLSRGATVTVDQQPRDDRHQ
ncbi:MAG TPA: OmpA family protein [Candidatus Kapabacteria bacterium]|nr:OmpA family protein [Candidatus Kapabacteria bacterium]